MPILLDVRYYNDSFSESVTQRSMIRKLSFTFDMLIDPNGIIVTKINSPWDNTTGSTVYGNITLNLVSTVGFQYNFSIVKVSGLTEVSGSLVDGNYNISLNPVLIPGATIVPPTTFHRLFGDINNDSIVNSADQTVFNSAYRSRIGMPNYLSYLDFNQDKIIDASDLTQFQRRL